MKIVTAYSAVEAALPEELEFLPFAHRNSFADHRKCSLKTRGLWLFELAESSTTDADYICGEGGLRCW